ncbi:cytochrome P450 [Schizophyllum fasciatum]
MSLADIYLALAVTSAVTVAVLLFVRRLGSRLPLPPGPRKLPILGNLFNMPSSFEWERYAEWARELATDIIHLNVAGQSIVVLDSYEACTELLEKRSIVYSGRPSFPMTVGLCGMDFNIFTMSYGEKWRIRRRLMHGALNAAASANFHPIVSRVTHAFLRGMLDAGPADLGAELRLMAGKLILAVAYGIDVQSKDDPHVVDADELLQVLTETSLQGAYLVNSVPALRYVPEWMPGANFQRVAREWRGKSQELMDRPFLEAKRNFLSGCAPNSSFAMSSLEQGIDDKLIRDGAASMYNGGTDTTVVTLLNFTLAMLDNPEMQRRAQAELDAVLGPLEAADGSPGQLPTFADEPQLPFITALLRESTRYKPVTPVSISHAYTGTEPDIYQGYAIPPGSIVIPNVWSMMHDEAAYPDSFAFKPERFLTAEGQLDPTVRDPEKMSFGFGRRICIGRHLAHASLWLTIASTLRVYNIEKAKREGGTDIEPHREWVSSLVMYPKQFKCAFVPRSAAAETVIRATGGMEY